MAESFASRAERAPASVEITTRIHPCPQRQLSRRRLLVGAGAAAAAAPLVLPGLAGAQEEPDGYGGTTDSNGRAFGFPAADMTSKITKDITFPVDGDVSWTDTYGACRDGCSRRHEGQDLIGKKLLKLVACVSGTVVELRHQSGGNSLYLRGDDGWYYAYIHINNDSPGTDDGKNPYAWAFASGVSQGGRVSRGQHVAYMGDSGNAESSSPQLHFEIRKPADSVWNSQAVNARYSLEAASPPPPTVPASTFDPWDNADDLIKRQYADFLGRAPDAGGLAHYRGLLNTGQRSPDWLIEYLLGSDGCQNQAGRVFRLYRAYFLRDPDYDGFAYWLRQARGGTSSASISAFFARSGEFTNRYGNTSNAGFVELVYRNVLGRPADAEGRAYWISQLDTGKIDRGLLMLQFSEGAENVGRMRHRTVTALVYALMAHRMPNDDAHRTWTIGFTTGQYQYQQLIAIFRHSDEYAGIVGSA